MKKRFKVDILDYVVTSNHIHLLLTARTGNDISPALQFLHGSVGQKYNIMKKREGSFWSDRFHATRIQSGNHLRSCMFYIDLNMVRTGAVKSPDQWKHCGIHEFFGEKKRYRIINIPHLLKRLEFSSVQEFREWYRNVLKEKLSCISCAREAYWSEAVAVGDPEWLESAAVDAGMRRFAFKNQKVDGENGYVHFLAGKN
jgi:putative transposase